MKTRTGLVDRLEDVISGRKEIDADLLDELEYTLITADIGVKTTSEILESIRQRVDRKMVGDARQIKLLIKEHLLEVLESVERPMPRVTEPPAVVVVVGVNGSGKNDYHRQARQPLQGRRARRPALRRRYIPSRCN